MPAEMHKLTNCSSGENFTEPQLETASCLFSILPYGQAVPALVYVFVLLTLYSFLANLLILLVLVRSEEFSWPPRFTLLKNQTLSELIKSATLGPAVIHALVQQHTMPFSTCCYVLYFMVLTTRFSTCITITCMALERYLSVCHPGKYLGILTETCMRRVTWITWISSITMSVVTIVLLHTGSSQSSVPVTMGLLCEPKMMEQHFGFPRASVIFCKVMSCGMPLLYLLIFLVFYFWMYQDPSNAVIPFNTHNKKARKTMLLDCCMFLMELLLQVILDALWEFRSPAAMTGLSAGDVRMVKPELTTTAAVLHMSPLLMLMVVPCANPLVLWLTNVKLRQALLSLFRWVTEVAGLAERLGDAAHRNRAPAV